MKKDEARTVKIHERCPHDDFICRECDDPHDTAPDCYVTPSQAAGLPLSEQDLEDVRLMRRCLPHMTPVRILESPVTNRVWYPGILALLNRDRTRIRIGAYWFDFDDRWKVVEPPGDTDLSRDPA